MDTGDISGRIVYYEDGEVIFQENSVGSEIYIIESGKVEISQRISGRETTIAVLGKGSLFGEMAMFIDAPRTATAAAIGKTTLMSFSMEEMLQRMQTSLQFTITVLRSLASRLRDTNSTLRTSIDRVYEFGDGFVESLFPEKRHVKVGEILIEMNYLTGTQLERALQKQKEIHMLESNHKLLGEIMVESGIITDEQLRSALAEQRERLRHVSD